MRACERKRGAYSYHLGGSTYGRCIASTILGWYRAAANTRVSAARLKPSAATSSSMNAFTSGRAAYPVGAGGCCFLALAAVVAATAGKVSNAATSTASKAAANVRVIGARMVSSAAWQRDAESVMAARRQR